MCVHARLVIAATFWNLVILYSADQSFNAQDDKNNLTAPSTGNFKKAPNPNTLENIDKSVQRILMRLDVIPAHNNPFSFFTSSLDYRAKVSTHESKTPALFPMWPGFKSVQK